MTPPYSKATENDATRKLRQSVIITDEQWERFLVEFDVVFPGLIERLRDNYPTLSVAELRYLSLFILRRTNKEMSKMLGVTVGAIRTVRYRLRIRLNFSTDDELRELINKCQRAG